MNAVPSFAAVEKSAQIVSMLVNSFDLKENASKIFNQYCHVKTYCSTEKIADWKEKKAPADLRWVEIFQHMETENVPYKELAKLVEFALCLPGTNASVERVFSTIKQLWRDERSRLEQNTIRAILFVKNNLDYNCVDFYSFLKQKPDLLKQIAAQDKYSFKNVETDTTTTSQAASTREATADCSRMSIE